MSSPILVTPYSLCPNSSPQMSTAFEGPFASMAGPAGGNFLAPSLACQSQCGTRRRSGDYGGLTGSQAHRGGLAKHGSTMSLLSGEYFPHSTHESQAHLGRPLSINPTQGQHFFSVSLSYTLVAPPPSRRWRYAKAVGAGSQSFER